MPSPAYSPRKPRTIEAPYVIEFVDVPMNMGFLLDKTPKFYTKVDAFRALANYEFEFGAYGNVHHIREGRISVETIILHPIESEE